MQYGDHPIPEKKSEKIARKLREMKYPKQLTDENGVVFHFLGEVECLGKKYGGYATAEEAGERDFRSAEFREGRVALLTAMEEKAMWDKSAEKTAEEFLETSGVKAWMENPVEFAKNFNSPPPNNGDIKR